MIAEMQAILMLNQRVIEAPALALPVIKPLLHLAGMDEVLQVPLRKLTLAEEEVARRDLVAERLTDLADAKGNLQPRRFQHILVIQIDVLARLAAQIGLGALALEIGR